MLLGNDRFWNKGRMTESRSVDMDGHAELHDNRPRVPHLKKHQGEVVFPASRVHIHAFSVRNSAMLKTEEGS